ncbi:MAG: hypothetical protein Q7U16_09235 [Agitococcus sp.]|jgi:hypothetical protein|nr:hypothetical protein [Agitococcus sp.]
MYVTLKQVHHAGSIYLFEFECDSRIGIIELNMETQNVSLVRQMDGNTGSQNYFRARAAILRELKNGNIPTETCFASA